MRNFDTITKELTQVVNNLGYYGDVVSAVVACAAYYHLNNQTDVVTSLMEGTMSRSKLMNSKILLSGESMYSVFRGTNPRITIKIKPTSVISFGVGDLVISRSGYSLYSVGNVNATPSDSIVFIECIIATSQYTTNRSISLNEVDSLYLHENINVSEDIHVSRNGNENVKTNNNFIEHIVNGGIFCLTKPDFSVELFLKEKFTVNDEYVISSYSYTELTDAIKSDLARLTSSKFIVYNEDRVVVSGTPPETQGAIMLNANLNKYSNQILRSNTDITSIFNNYFASRVFGSKYNVANNKISIYYIPRITDLNSTEIENFKTERALAYYIAKEVDVIKATEVELSVTVTLNHSVVSTTDITKELLLLDNTQGEHIDAKMLVSKLSQVLGVNYVESVVLLADGAIYNPVLTSTPNITKYFSIRPQNITLINKVL